MFVQAPVPGRVKLRLADEIGPSGAAEVHWQIGRRIVAQIAASGFRTTIWYRPAGESRFVREWLDGLGRFDLRPQPPGRLGDRLARAFARHFVEGARRAVMIGTDCPGIDRRLVAEAFTALAAADVVLGPTGTGGCYLVALREPQPQLLRGLEAASPALGSAFLQQLNRRAAAARLHVRLLRPLRPVYTATDARLAGLLESRPSLDRN
ncbi:MAG: TIGR04282 family arsenosugar biosynthesis glycosyltransferase [Gemmatimonadales bacterium]